MLTFSSTDGVSTKMHQNNVFTVAKRNLEGQDMIYQAIKFTNNVWALTELKIQPGNPIITVSEVHPMMTHRWRAAHSDLYYKIRYDRILRLRRYSLIPVILTPQQEVYIWRRNLSANNIGLQH